VRDGGGPLAALRAVHVAINATAGRVVLEGDLEHFVAEHPRYAAVAGDLARFFVQSRQALFAGGAQGVDAAFVADLCRRCRNLERGTA
jgi:mxaA protein